MCCSPSCRAKRVKLVNARNAERLRVERARGRQRCPTCGHLLKDKT